MTEPRRRLDAWKEIAAYLKRDMTTVRRWEKREGLPVHRHLHDKLGSVYAYTDEIDEWCERRRATIEAPPQPPDINGNVDPRQVRLRSLTGTFVAAAAIAAMTLGPARVPLPADSGRPMTLALEPPDGVILTSMALSPDGDQIAFTAHRPGAMSQLWIRPLDSTQPIALAGTDGASFPFWSPDARRLGFFAGGKLKTTSLTTHEVRVIAEAVDPRGGTWSRHGVILFSPASGGPIYRVDDGGGPPAPITSVPSAPPGGHAWPAFLPDGDRFLYLDLGWPDAHGIYAADLRTGQTRRLIKAFSSPGYDAATGHLLYVNGQLLAHRFDPDRLEVRGKPVAVASNVLVQYALDHKAEFSVSSAGPLAVRHGADGRSRLVWLDRSGQELDAYDDASAFSNPVLSPDGTRALATVYRADDSPGHLWLIDLLTRRRTQLTFTTASDFAPIWSPASDRIVFASNRAGPPGFYQRDLAGDAERRLPWSPGASIDGKILPWALLPDGWTRDAKYVTYSVRSARTQSDIWAIEMSGDGRSFPVVRGPQNDAHGQVSPDGRAIAFVSDESGAIEVYAQSFPAAGRRVRISTAGGADPRWRDDGQELFYISADRKLMAVPVTPGAVPRYGTPHALQDLPVRALWNDMRNNYDVTANGQRFLAVVPRRDPLSAHFTLIFGWRQALAR